MCDVMTLDARAIGASDEVCRQGAASKADSFGEILENGSL